ncbi:MAG: class I SAM-dependent methyltransferase [Spirochaetales bacterium]|nr:class I SAM-dependent methyltransferase [Spirochaetales bacterium]
MAKKSACVSCSSISFSPLFSCNDKNMNIPGEYHYHRCTRCGLIILDPRPSVKQLLQHYPQETYYAYSTIDTDSIETKIRQILYRVFFDVSYKNILIKLLLKPFKFLSRSTLIAKKSRLLDVGCGAGQFVYEMKKLGADAQGVEPYCDANTKKKPGITIFHGELIKAKFRPGYFDVITMNHVLEHIQKPKQTLQEIFRILKPNGRFIVAVPNAASLAYGLFGKNWYQIDTPRHIFLYTTKILRSMLVSSGFTIKKIRFNSGPRQFSHSLLHFFNIRWMYKCIGILDILFLPLVHVVNFFHIGDQFEIICTKE